MQFTGRDQLFPDDCGRDDNNKGNLCFPDGLLCQNSKIRTSHQNLLFLKGLLTAKIKRDRSIICSTSQNLTTKTVDFFSILYKLPT